MCDEKSKTQPKTRFQINQFTSICDKGKPSQIISDNGTEFTSQAVLKWSQDHNIDWRYIDPGKPMQNGTIESFNGKVRDEFLNQHWFITLKEARELTEKWR